MGPGVLEMRNKDQCNAKTRQHPFQLRRELSRGLQREVPNGRESGEECVGIEFFELDFLRFELTLSQPGRERVLLRGQ